MAPQVFSDKMSEAFLTIYDGLADKVLIWHQMKLTLRSSLRQQLLLSHNLSRFELHGVDANWRIWSQKMTLGVFLEPTLDTKKDKKCLKMP